MTDDSTRQRSPRRDLIIVREGKRAADPLSRQIISWHAAAARLAARMNHARLKGHSTQAIQSDAAALAETISSEVVTFRAQLSQMDYSGRVEDALRSASRIIGTLEQLVDERSIDDRSDY